MESRSSRRRGAVAALSIAAVSIALHVLVVGGLALEGGPSTSERAPTAVAVVEARLLRPAPAPAPAPAAAPKTRPPRESTPPPRPKPAAPVARPAAATPPATIRAPAAPAAAAAAMVASPPAPPDPSDFGAQPEPAEAGDAAVADAAAPVDSDGRDAESRPGTTDATGRDALAVQAGSDAEAQVEAQVERAPLPPLPGSHARRFQVYWGDFTDGNAVARLEYRLDVDGDRYEIRTAAEAQGLISLVYSGTLTQVSRGRHGLQGLEPLHYAEQRGRRAERSVAFDPDARLLRPTGRAPVPLPPGTQDRLSVFYQLGLLARADPAAFSPGSTPVVPVASLREVQRQRFEVVGDEILMAPGGPLHTLHLRRPAPSGSDDPEIDVWLGYDFEMLPVRLRIQDSGRRVLDQLIEREG